ncbi:MAG: DUF126 domain-containing protein [Nitrososphaeria archaeon]|jgi:predicted aconitase with swiveling domain
MIVASIKGRGLVEGIVRGEIIATRQALSFLGGVDRLTGKIVDQKNDLYQEKVGGKVLYIPKSVGSTVGAYVIYAMSKRKLGPKAIICKDADSMLVTGCAISGIPLIDGISFSKLFNSKLYAIVNGNKGTLDLLDEMNNSDQTESLEIKS